MNGWLFLAIVTLLCLGVFANGLRFSRGADRFASQLGQSPANVRRIGQLFIMAAPLFWLITLALCLGLFGPVPNIQPIQF
ncbi:hypothetical protein EAH87_10415 [Sphingomonas koreensis]|nr:hypothetical protein EAH87_10415 [Sphingomonas koreensis]